MIQILIDLALKLVNDPGDGIRVDVVPTPPCVGHLTGNDLRRQSLSCVSCRGSGSAGDGQEDALLTLKNFNLSHE